MKIMVLDGTNGLFWKVISRPEFIRTFGNLTLPDSTYNIYVNLKNKAGIAVNKNTGESECVLAEGITAIPPLSTDEELELLDLISPSYNPSLDYTIDFDIGRDYEEKPVITVLNTLNKAEKILWVQKLKYRIIVTIILGILILFAYGIYHMYSSAQDILSKERTIIQNEVDLID